MTDSPSLLMAVRAIKAQALRDAADATEETMSPGYAANEFSLWLRDRADRIEKGEQP